MPSPQQLSHASLSPKSAPTQPISKPGLMDATPKPCSTKSSLKPNPTQPRSKHHTKRPLTKPISKDNPTEPSSIPDGIQLSAETGPTNPSAKPSSSQPDASLAGPSRLHLSMSKLFCIYLQICFPFYVLIGLAESQTAFLAMILPLPIIIIITSFSICLTNISQSVKKGQKCSLKSKNDEIYKDKLSQDHSIEQGDMGKLSSKTCISIHTHMKIFLPAFFMYECYFDSVYHLPIESLLLRIIIATIFRVQFS